MDVPLAREAGRVEHHGRNRAARRCAPRSAALLSPRLVSWKSWRDRDVSPDDELFVHDPWCATIRPWPANLGRRRPVLDQGPRVAWSVLLDRCRSVAGFSAQDGAARGVNHTMKSESTSATTGLKVGANPEATHRMSCMEIWGGNTSVETS